MNMLNAGIKILMENATSLDDRQTIFALMENELSAVNNAMITNLYKSAIDKAHIDFDDIPDSRGNITRYSGYNAMMETIQILKDIAVKSNVKIPELDIVEQAISNITGAREIFEKGFALEKDFIILQYNTLVLACVESVSIIISSYVDFIKRPDKNEFTIIRSKERSGYLAVQNLDKFNAAVRQGDFSKVNNAILNSGKEGFVGVDDVIVPVIIIGAVLVLVPLIRELIFLFYYSRMRVSDYLTHQAALLEINKQNVESGNAPVKRKTEIVKKQSETIRKLQSLSEKIKIDKSSSEHSASANLKKENQNWSIHEVKAQATPDEPNGFQLL